jgi:hypothetical protein
MLADDLLAQARDLATKDPRRPRQANLRRAVSASYYALFHFLAEMASRQMMGGGREWTPYRQLIARAADHNAMKEVCKQFAAGALRPGLQKSLPTGFQVSLLLRQIGQTFVNAQELRHLADYDLGQRFSRSDTLGLHEKVRMAIDDFRQLPDDAARRLFLACLLTWKTLGGR